MVQNVEISKLFKSKILYLIARSKNLTKADLMGLPPELSIPPPVKSPFRAGRTLRGGKRWKCAPLVDYRVFGAGVLIQSGGKRLRARCPQPLVEVPDIKFEVFIEIIHPMYVRGVYIVTWEVYWPLIGQNIKMTIFLPDDICF
jgi:hypothetical protein